MSREPEGSSTSDFALVPPKRVLAKLRTPGVRLWIFEAPSGYGKAACLKRLSRGFAISDWLNAETIGDELPTRLAEMLRRIRTDSANLSATPGSRLIVLQEVDAPLDGVTSDALMSLCESGASIAITTSTVRNIPTSILVEASTIDAAELRLTLDDLQELSGSLGRAIDARCADSILEASGGHPGLARVMLMHPMNTPGAPPSVSAGLKEWVKRASRDLTPDERSLLAALAWLRRCSVLDLTMIGLDDPAARIRQLFDRFPFIQECRGRTSARWRVHELVAAALADETQDALEGFAGQLVHLLSQRGDLPAAASVILRTGDQPAIRTWALSYGWRLLDGGHGLLTQSLIQSLSSSALLSSPGLLLLAAEASRDCGDYEECLARARAAIALAKFEGDVRVHREALMSCIRANLHLARTCAAASSADELLRMSEGSDTSDSDVLMAVSVAAVHVYAGSTDTAETLLANAERHVAAHGASRKVQAHLQNARAVLHAVQFGDFALAVKMLTPFTGAPDLMNADRTMVLGNLACGLMETGRTERSLRLFREIFVTPAADNPTDVLAEYGPFLGCALAAEGDFPAAVSEFERGIAAAHELRDECSAAISRVYLAAVLRAGGRAEDALESAELAADCLATDDPQSFYEFSVVEVAASFIAVGDCAAARAWVSGVSPIQSKNQSLLCRHAMVSATLALRSGDSTAAAEALQPFREYILSGNANWQAAMYIRAFPELLGAFALAIGPADLPVHMLRMVLPEYAERSLLATRSVLTEEMWRDLGVRLLGQDEFSEFLHRDGRPLCRVRLFGGLEVSVGGRAIRDRDWKKRKARLLFAMLVTRHGNDVPRDQIFDYLWPDMDEERAKNNLYVAWSTMKSALMGDEPGRCPYVESVGGVCKVVSENLRSDVDEFEAALAAARAAEKDGDAAAELVALRRVSDAYRGDLLPGDVYDDWFAQLRDQYRSDFCQAMLRASELLCDAERPADGLGFARRAIRVDPLREDLYQAALRCQIAAGQRGAAIDLYQQCKTRLADDLGLDPSVETKALYDRILAMEDAPVNYGFDLLED